MKFFFQLLFPCLFLVSTLFPQSLEQLLKEGDNFAENIYDNHKALEKYLQADKLSPKNWEVYWRISRTYVDIAEHMPSSTSEQKDAQLEKFQTAYDYADRAIKLAPDKSVNYVRRAAANGKIALFKGVFSVLGIVNSVKSDAEKAIKLGNGGPYIQAVAHYILGRTHAKVCEKSYLVRMPLGLGWGDIEIAEKEIKKALELHPDFRMFYLDLAKVYVEQDEYKKARDVIARLEKSPKADEDDDKLLTEARALREKIKNE